MNLLSHQILSYNKIMEDTNFLYLGLKVNPGPIQRCRIEDINFENNVEILKSQVQIKSNLPADSFELIYHGKILKNESTLNACGIKAGSMVHVVKKKTEQALEPPPAVSDAEIQQIVTSLRTFGCTPNAPGWTRAMQVLNNEQSLSEMLDAVPGLSEDCVTMSMLHEIELLAALGASVSTMRRGVQALPNLAPALRQLTRLVRSQGSSSGSSENVPTSGFAYSLEALSEDEDGDEEESESNTSSGITQEQLTAALQAASEVMSGSGGAGGSAGAGGGAGAGSGASGLLRLLRRSAEPARAASSDSLASPGGAGGRNVITPDMFSAAISEAMNAASASGASSFTSPATPMDHSGTASSSLRGGLGASAGVGSGAGASSLAEYAEQLQRMREMGLLDEGVNLRALLVCAGDVNAAINLVFSGAID